MEELPEDILNILNGGEKDSNLVGKPKKQELPTDLQKQLDDYNRNFDMLNSALGEASMLDAAATTELRVEKTRDMLSMALPVAVQCVIEIANYAQSDSVRLKAAMYIIDKMMGKDVAIAQEDEATKLLRKLSEGRE